MKKVSFKALAYSLVLVLIWGYLLTINSCQMSDGKLIPKISEMEIKLVQNAWSQSIIGIGGAHKNNRNYKDLAKRHVQNFYGFDEGQVLVKPAYVRDKKFRTTAEGVISYLIGDNPNFPEDEGFALNQWTNIRWENAGIINGEGEIALAMGNYYFSDTLGKERQLEFTIAFKKNKEGQLKIVAHKTAHPTS